MINNLNNLGEFEFYLEKSQKQLLLVKFSTSSCAPCIRIQKEIDKLLKEEQKLLFLKIDATKFPSLAQKFNIQSVPALILFNQGKIVKEQIGYVELPELREFIKIK